jgi:hypothetical protein
MAYVAGAARERHALLLCSDLLAFPHDGAMPPATAGALQLALQMKQSGDTPAASGQHPGAPPPD